MPPKKRSASNLGRPHSARHPHSALHPLSVSARAAVERGLADAKARRFGRPPDLVADAALVRKLRDDT